MKSCVVETVMMMMMMMFLSSSFAFGEPVTLPHFGDANVTKRLEQAVDWALRSNYKIAPNLFFKHEVLPDGRLNMYVAHNGVIAEGEILVKAPFSEILYPDTCIQDAENVFPGLKKSLEGIPQDGFGRAGKHFVIAAYIAAVRKFGYGKFVEYVQSLPRENEVEYSHPIFYPDAEVFRPFGENVFDLADFYVRAARVYYKAMDENYKEKISFEEFRFGWYLVATRVYFARVPEKTLAMVPIADLFNNHPDYDVYQKRKYSDDPADFDGHFNLVTDQGYDAGVGEVFGQYGSYSNSEYAIIYGFYMKDYKYDYIYIEDDNDDEVKMKLKKCRLPNKTRATNRMLDAAIQKFRDLDTCENEFMEGLIEYTIEKLESCKRPKDQSAFSMAIEEAIYHTKRFPRVLNRYLDDGIDKVVDIIEDFKFWFYYKTGSIELRNQEDRHDNFDL